MKKLFIALITSTLLTSPGAINAATHYLFNDLQAQFSERILVKSINDSGQIAGVRLDGFSYDTATIWDSSTETPLITPNGGISWGLGINNAGQVIGASVSGAYHATYWNGATATTLETLGGLQSEAYDINNSGQIVGYSNTPRGTGANQEHATLWNGTTLVDLGTLPGGFSSHAYAISDNGKIVGDSQIGKTGQAHATLWNGNHVIDLGTLPGGNFSHALDINNLGQVAGYSETQAGSFKGHAVIWDDGHIIDIGTLGGSVSHAFAINDHGLVVGDSYTAEQGNPHAFFWHDSQMIDLNSLLDQSVIDAGWILTSAVDINNNGQIIGVAYNDDSRQVTQYLLTPTTPIPEPQTYGMLLAGLGLIGGFRALRKR